MKQTSGRARKPAEVVIKDIRRATRRQFSSEEKIRVVLEGLRGDDSIADLCRREGIAASMYYGWFKKFLEAGKKRQSGDKTSASGRQLESRETRVGEVQRDPGGLSLPDLERALAVGIDHDDVAVARGQRPIDDGQVAVEQPGEDYAVAGDPDQKGGRAVDDQEPLEVDFPTR